MAFAHEEEVLVQSFLNYHDFAGDSLDAIADLPEAEQRDRFGGTLAPTLRLAVDGDRTRLRGTLDAWRIPTPDEPLPPADDSELPDRDDLDGRIREGGSAGGYAAVSGGPSEPVDDERGGPVDDEGNGPVDDADSGGNGGSHGAI
jgi:levansucrase